MPELGLDLAAAGNKHSVKTERPVRSERCIEKLVELAEHSRALFRRELHLVAFGASVRVDDIEIRSQMVAACAGERRPRENRIHQFLFILRALHGVARRIQQREFAARLPVPDGKLSFERAVRRFQAQFESAVAGRSAKAREVGNDILMDKITLLELDELGSAESVWQKAVCVHGSVPPIFSISAFHSETPGFFLR